VLFIFGGFGLSVSDKALAQEAICPYCGEVCSRKAGYLIKEWEATPKKQATRRPHPSVYSLLGVPQVRRAFQNRHEDMAQKGEKGQGCQGCGS
jgi:hypothetical protein